MTLPDEEFDSVTETDGFTYTAGRNAVITQRENQDVVKTARTLRDGTVVTATSYVPVPARQPGKDVLGREAGHVVRPEDRKQIVTNWSGPKDYDNCPPSYQECFKQYHSYITYLVRNMGVHPRELADVVADIEARFLERDSLGEFSPEWATRSAKGRSVFRSYLSRFVVTYARGKNRNNIRFSKRYLTICNALAAQTGAPVSARQARTTLEKLREAASALS